jgi:hypothetical protein
MAKFHLFRYQILPINRYFQLSYLSDIKTIEQLLSKKNELFSKALEQVKDFNDSRHETVVKKLYKTDDFFLYKIAINRSIRRETKEFTEEYIDHWPSVLVGIWNDPEMQLVAVQKRTTAFKRTEIVIKLILNSINPILSRNNLSAFYEPLFEKRVFWNIINEYKGRIQKIEFNFLTPNMANISGELPENLKEFAKITNSIENELSIEADEQSSLHIERSNQALQGLVDYSSQGGGDIAVKISGLKKKIHTSKTVKEIEVEDLQLQGTSEEVVAVLKELMK